MKRLMLLCLCLCLLASAALADGTATTLAVVSNPDAADRLNLRAEPSTQAESLGRFYNGTLVRVMSQPDAAWVQVAIGTEGAGVLTGYMQTKYLDFSMHNLSVALPSRTLSLQTALLTGPEDGATALATLEKGSVVTVLGDLRLGAFVNVGGLTGYIPMLSGRVDMPTDASGALYVNNPNPADRLNLRAEPSTQAESLGRFYNGTPVTVKETEGAWAKVAIGALSGWMQTAYLSATAPGQEGPITVQTHANVTFTQEPDLSSLSTTGFSAGTHIQIYGDLPEGWHYARWNNEWGYLQESDIERDLTVDLSQENGAAG